MKGYLHESDIQRQLREYLELLGWRVFETHKALLPVRTESGKQYARSAAMTRGTPDMFACHPRHGCHWIAVEVKGPLTRVTPEQRALAESGHSFICRNLKDLEDALAQFTCQGSGPSDQNCSSTTSSPISKKSGVTPK